ncbi:MAG: PAS domain S-box protein [Verrucomicrobia bacterium]|nr:PAS domain S-box protein [Verrucomicrobiota bacterium]
MNPVKLLYLEDDALDRRAFLRMVRDKALPYAVTAAETMAEARAHLAEARFDIVVADYNLPDGRCTELFDEQPETPFVLITGTMGDQLALRTLERGADDYLNKDPQQLHLAAVPAAVDKTLKRHQLRRREQQLARELREAHARITSFLENISDGFAALDREWRVLSINAAGARILRQQAEDLVGTVLWEAWPRLAESAARAALRRAVAEQVPVNVEAFCAEPLSAWFELRGSPAADGLSLFFTDITERQRAAEALRENEERLRLAVEAGEIGTYETDFQAGRMRFNHQFCRILGLPAGSELTHEETERLIHPDDRERTRKEFAASRNPASGGASRLEFRVVRPDGAVRWVSLRGRTLFRETADGPAPFRALGAVVDITERVQAETELKRQAEELRTINKDLARFNRLTVGRELRMIELKREVNTLCAQCHQPSRYDLSFTEKGTPPKP